MEDPTAYNAEGVLYLTPTARFDYLLALPEGAAVGQAVNDAMRAIERDNKQLAGILPKSYEIFTSTLLKELLKRVSEIPASLDYDAFGRIYEYFLGEFARSEGQKGGEFFAQRHCPASRGSVGTVPWARARSRVWLGRHVRPERPGLSPSTKRIRLGTLHPRPGERGRNR